VLQFLLGISDRQAAEAVRCRIDFKYALAMERDDPGFHHSVLADFRERLAQDDRADRLLDLALARLKEGRSVDAYGTLRLAQVQLSQFGRLLDGSPGALPGHRMTTIRITDPAVIRATGTDRHPLVVVSADPEDTVGATSSRSARPHRPRPTTTRSTTAPVIYVFAARSSKAGQPPPLHRDHRPTELRTLWPGLSCGAAGQPRARWVSAVRPRTPLARCRPPPAASACPSGAPPPARTV
jgi:hypothetical protein